MLKKFRFNLAGQILAGYLVVIVVAVVATLFCIRSLRANQQYDESISEVILPVYLQVKELAALNAEMSQLINSWIYQPSQDDKQRLLKHLQNTLPQASKNLAALLATANQKNEAIDAVLNRLTGVAERQQKITVLLAVDSLYSNDVIVDEAITILEKEVAKPSEEISVALQQIIKQQEIQLTNAQLAKAQSYRILTGMLIAMICIFIITSIIAFVNVRSRIVKPIVQLRDVLIDLGLGKIVTLKSLQRKDEVGQMYAAMTQLTAGLTSKSLFAKQIGMGNYEQDFQLLSEDDEMGKALITMRDNLKKNADEERKRSWSVTGLAQFAELLRDQGQDLSVFGDRVLKFCVSYINANQGRLYVVNDDNIEDVYLDLVSSYAWGKKKFISERIDEGQGLTGQAWQEGELIYMTQVPVNYVKITSGLGEANPRCILIAPLKTRDKTYGVLELASFNELADHEREFIVKLSENLASAISAAQINSRTKSLLTQTQQQAEEMRSQEEEMRQNMEELNATQEQMQRKEQEYVNRITMLEKQLGALN